MPTARSWCCICQHQHHRDAQDSRRSGGRPSSSRARLHARAWVAACNSCNWLAALGAAASSTTTSSTTSYSDSEQGGEHPGRRAARAPCRARSTLGLDNERAAGPAGARRPPPRLGGAKRAACSWRRARHRDLDRERTRARDVPTPCQIAADRGQPRLRLVGAARATRYADGFRGSRRPGDAVCDGCSFLIQALSQQLLPSNPLQRQPLQWPAFCQR